MQQKFALVFPGQGSQSVGMLAELAEHYSCVRQTFAEASAVLDYDLWQVVQHGPASRLDETQITQPALLAADIAVYRCWQQETEQQPLVMAGHSLGEYAALVVAGTLTFADAIALVAKRGLYMQQAVPGGQGAMAAIIGLSDAQVQSLCDTAAEGEVVVPANYNSLGQVVIAGHLAAVERAIELAKAAGAKLAKLIPVSVPSHCPLMQPAAYLLRQDLARVTLVKPRIPVIQNADVLSHDDPQKIAELLISQLTEPVRWVQTIQKMQADGVRLCIECGPAKVLTGLIKRIDRAILVAQTASVIELKQSVQEVLSL